MATLLLGATPPLCWSGACPQGSKCKPSSKVFLLPWQHQESCFISLLMGVFQSTGVSLQ